MLTVNRFDKSAICEPALSLYRAAASPDNIYVEDIGLWSNDFQTGYLNDRLLDDLSIELLLPAVNFYRFVGYQHDESARDEYLGYSPVSNRHYDGWMDLLRFGSLAAGAMRLWRKPKTANWGWDSDTNHVSYRGQIDSTATSHDLYPNRVWISRNNMDYHAYAPAEIRPHGLISLVDGKPKIVSLPPYYEPWYHNDRRVPIVEFISMLARAGAEKTLVRQSGYAHNTLIYNNFAVNERVLSEGNSNKDFLATRTEITYDLVVHAWSERPCKDGIAPSGNFRYSVKHILVATLRLLPRDIPIVAGPAYQRVESSSGWWTSYTLLDYDVTHVLPANYTWPFYTVENLTRAFEQSVPHIVREPADGYVVKNHQTLLQADDPLYNTTNALLDKYNSLVEEVHPDIIYWAALSANDAVMSYTHSDLNLIEGVPQLPSMLSGLKNVSDFMSHLKSLSSGNVAASSEIIDDLAEGYLAYHYGYSPTIADVQEARTQAEIVYNRMSTHAKTLPRVLYGKFFYRFPNNIQLKGYEGDFTVTVRSKVSLNPSNSALLAWVLTLDQVGMLPTLTRAWDLVKFSFVLDWFTSLGDRLQDVDSNAIRFAIDINSYIHTFEYSYRPSDKLLSRYGCSSDDFTLRVYKRYRSLFNPLLRDGRFDPHPPKGLSKSRHLAAGSLLWVSK